MLFKRNPKGKEGLRQAILDLISKQIDAGDPPETKQTLNRLMESGCTREDAFTLLGRVATAEFYFMMFSGRDIFNPGDFNMERYVANLHRLPDEPRDLDKDV